MLVEIIHFYCGWSKVIYPLGMSEASYWPGPLKGYILVRKKLKME